MPASMMIACVALRPKVTGKQDGDAGKRPDARQYADERADQAAEKRVPDVCWLKGDGKAVMQGCEGWFPRRPRIRTGLFRAAS